MVRTNPDVTELRDFYRSPLGQLARDLLTARIRACWPDVSGLNIYGLGFAAPYMESFLGESNRLGALMPARQGVLVWPHDEPYRSLLVDEQELPLLDGSADRLLLIHYLEMSEAAHDLLHEIWRVLAPEGRLLIIVPNRRGIWARFDSTPFGHGRPYSAGQLRRLLRHARFAPETIEHALFVPPANDRLFLKSARLWEQAGMSFWPPFSGVLLADARKEVYAPIGGKKQFVPADFAIPVPAVPRAMLQEVPQRKMKVLTR